MGRPQYKAEKRRKEIARQKKQEEKRLKRLEKKQAKADGLPGEEAAAEYLAEREGAAAVSDPADQADDADDADDADATDGAEKKGEVPPA